MSNLTRTILNAAQHTKPILLRLFPASFLRRVKSRLLRTVGAKIENDPPRPFDRRAYPDGINLIGPIDAATGLGQSCRLVAQAIKAAGIPFCVHAYHPINTQKSARVNKPIAGPLYNINILHINAPEIPVAFVQLGRALWDGRYNIVFWLWESEDFPAAWLPALRLADEIWTPSDFAGIAVKKHTDKPVLTMPYPLSEVPTRDIPTDQRFDRAHFSLPEDVFLFLCAYDGASVSYRKNPLGAAMAFKSAFGPHNDKCGLIIKAGHASDHDLAPIKDALSGMRHVYFIRDELTRLEMNGLLQCADVYVSLHRAEGFGLVCAEAMFLGKPVIATNWSATVEFMPPDAACLVDFSLIELDKDYPPFAKGTRWADPDIHHAAAYMGRLYAEPAYYQTISQQARAHIRRTLHVRQAAERIHKRIREISR